MANKTYALEWISFSKKNLDTARLLFDVNHYEDIIGVEIQQSLEKLLKATMANKNIKIPKEHDLLKLYFMIENDFIELNENEFVFLRLATNYYKEDRYPNPNYCLPPKNEIKQVLDFAEALYKKICKNLEINEMDVIK